MVIIIKDKIIEYLRTIGRDQSWLAKEFGVTKGYISLIVNNKCKMPLIMIERLLVLTGMRFENLFYFDGSFDRREFYGASVYDGEELLDNLHYKKTLDKKKISWFNTHNKKHNH